MPVSVQIKRAVSITISSSSEVEIAVEKKRAVTLYTVRVS